MYEVSVDPIQRSIKVYNTDIGESKDNKTRYSTSMLITDLGLKECRLHFGQGVLNEEINNIVFKTVKDLGYRKAQFEVPEGTPASRLATYEGTADGLDRYTVILV